LAGHETTATGLAWTFDLLTRHPRVLDRLVAEVDAGEDAYVKAVVSESLRLRPVVALAGRRLHTELVVDGRVLPPGTDVTPPRATTASSNGRPTSVVGATAA